MKNLILTLSIFLFSYNIFSQNWIAVTKDASGNQYYIKSSIVSKGGDFGDDYSVIKIWVKKNMKKVTDERSKAKAKVYLNAYKLDLVEFDCSNSKSRILSSILYSSTGNIIGENSINSVFVDWNYVIPDSVGEHLFEKVCELFN